MSNVPTQQRDRYSHLFETYWRVFSRLQGQDVSEWLGTELSLAQVKVLFWLAHRGPTTIRKIGDQLQVGLPTASHLVEKLVAAGLAERIEDTEDRRYVRAGLTSAGYEKARLLRQGRGNLLRKWLEQLTPEEFEALSVGLEALRRIADLGDDEEF